MKILFAFLSACHNSRREHVINLRTQMRTWEKWGVTFDWKIVFGSPDSQPSENLWRPTGLGLDDNILNFPVNDTRPWLALKNQELFRYALEHDYDYVFRACDDSCVLPHRILAHKILFEHDYFGTMCGYGQIKGLPGAFVLRYLDYMHGGVGIGLSKRSMEMLIADNYPGPTNSPYPKDGMIDLLPTQAMKGGWNIYWDDLWIGEVLKGNISYSDNERNNTYYNYKVSVYDDPTRFASNKPFDEKIILARHSLKQMGTTNLTPGAFSTIYSKRAKEYEIPWEQISAKWNLHSPEEDARKGEQ